MLFTNVLVPVDFPEAAMGTVDLIKSMDQPMNVHLFSVVAKGESAPEVDARVKDAQKKLDAIRNSLLSKVNIKATSEVVAVAR